MSWGGFLKHAITLSEQMLYSSKAHKREKSVQLT